MEEGAIRETQKNSERDFYFSCSLLSRSAHFLSPQLLLLLLPHTHCSFHFQYVLSGREECPRQNSSGSGSFFSGQQNHLPILAKKFDTTHKQQL